MAESKSSARACRATDRKSQALAFRLEGKSYSAIGAELGITKQASWKLVIGEIDRMNEEAEESAEMLRRLEAERLDQLQIAIWDDALAGDLKAVDRALAIMSRRARLLGLDCPDRQEITTAGNVHVIPAGAKAADLTDDQLAAIIAAGNQGG